MEMLKVLREEKSLGMIASGSYLQNSVKLAGRPRAKGGWCPVNYSA